MSEESEVKQRLVQEQKDKKTENIGDEKKPEIQEKKKGALERRVKYSQENWKLIILMNLFSLLPVYFDYQVLNSETNLIDAAGSQNQEVFLSAIKYFIFANFFFIISNPINTFLAYLLSQKINKSMKKDLFRQVIFQDFQFFEKYNSGELVALFNKNLDEVASGQDKKSSEEKNAMKGATKALTHIVFLIRTHKPLALSLIFFIPVYYVLDQIFHKIYYHIDSLNEKDQDTRSNITNEVIQNIMTVKSFGNEDEEVKDYEEHLERKYNRETRKSLAISAESTIQKVLEVAKSLLIFYFSFQIFFVDNTEENGVKFGTSEMVIFIRHAISVLIIYNAGKSVLSQMGVQKKQATSEKMYNILDYQSTLLDKGQEVIADGEKVDIAFQDVSFFYPGSEDVTVLNKINLNIPHGDYAAFVGLSGSGKTTIIKLIQRFYDVSSGSIKIGEHYIKDLKVQQLRKKIGFVSQQLQLFNSTIEKNIAYGIKNYTQEDLINCCKMAGCYDFITDKSKFPNGFETNIGEKGTNLSGGQMQRIGIARALMKKPSILIFDEATSALDAEKEYEVQQNIENLVKNNNNQLTIIVIAHRLSTVVNCRNIYVLKKGEVVETGNHQSLIAQNGVYQDLIKRQLAGQDKKQEQPEKQEEKKEEKKQVVEENDNIIQTNQDYGNDYN